MVYKMIDKKQIQSIHPSNKAKKALQLAALLVIIFVTQVTGQVKLLWESNGAGDNRQNAIALSDGGLAVSSVNGNVVRINAMGDTLWNVNLDSTLNHREFFRSLLLENNHDELYVVFSTTRYHSNFNSRSSDSVSMSYCFIKYDINGHCLTRKSFNLGNFESAARILKVDSSIVVVFSKTDEWGSGDMRGIGPGGDLTIVRFSPLGQIEWLKSYRFPTGLMSLTNGIGAYFGFIDNNKQICLLVDVVDVEGIDDLVNSGRYFDPNSDTRPRRLRYGDYPQDTLNFQMILLNPANGNDTTIWIHNLESLFEVPLDGEIVLNRWPFNLLIKNGQQGIFAGVYTPRRLALNPPGGPRWVDDPIRFQIYRLASDFRVERVADFELKSLTSDSRRVAISITTQTAKNASRFLLAGKIMLADTSQWANTAFTEQVSAQGEDWIWRYGRKLYQEEPSGLISTSNHIFLLGTRDNPPGLNVPRHQNWIVKLAY